MRYATTAFALVDGTIPPEGPIDVAITNGLLAIVASDDASAVYRTPGADGKTKTHAASYLIGMAIDLGVPIDADALTEALAVTQPPCDTATRRRVGRHGGCPH
jgi:hypothetical protein